MRNWCCSNQQLRGCQLDAPFFYAKPQHGAAEELHLCTWSLEERLQCSGRAACTGMAVVQCLSSASQRACAAGLRLRVGVWGDDAEKVCRTVPHSCIEHNCYDRGQLGAGCL